MKGREVQQQAAHLPGRFQHGQVPDARQHLDPHVRHDVVLARRRRIPPGIGGAEDHEHRHPEGGEPPGHSSRGYTATALVEQRPDLVGSLALISTGPRLDALLPQPAILRAMLAPPFGLLLWRRRSDAVIRKGIGATLAGSATIPPGMVDDLRSTTYRAFRKALRENTAYLAEQSVPELSGRHDAGRRGPGPPAPRRRPRLRIRG